MAARVVCVCFPSGDRAFARYVQQLMPAERPSAQRLQERLRGVYPNSVVRPRELSGETQATWYIYRDGRALATFGGADWWQKPGLGWMRYAGGVITEANETVHEILGYPPGALIGQPLTILLVPTVEADAELIAAIFRETGLMESTMPIRGASGEPVHVEHRTELLPDGSVTSVVRPVALVVPAPRAEE